MNYPGLLLSRMPVDFDHGHALKNMLLDLMWLEIIFVTEWYLYGMGCQNMLLLLLHLHCSRNVCVP